MVRARRVAWATSLMNASGLRASLIKCLMRYPSAAAIRLRTLRLRLARVQIGRKCWIRRITIPRNPWDIVIDNRLKLDDEVVRVDVRIRNPVCVQVMIDQFDRNMAPIFGVTMKPK